MASADEKVWTPGDDPEMECDDPECSTCGQKRADTAQFCEDEVVDEARAWAADLSYIALKFDNVPTPIRALADRARRLADDLEDLVAELEGKNCYEVTRYHKTIFAENEEEALYKSWTDKARVSELEERVHRRPIGTEATGETLEM